MKCSGIANVFGGMVDAALCSRSIDGAEKDTMTCREATEAWELEGLREVES